MILTIVLIAGQKSMIIKGIGNWKTIGISLWKVAPKQDEDTGNF